MDQVGFIDLREIGLDDSYRKCIGTYSYSAGSPYNDPQFAHDFTLRVSHARLGWFLIRHPALAYAGLRYSLNYAGRQRPDMGNFTRNSGAPEYKESTTFAVWSDLKAWVFNDRGGLSFVFLRTLHAALRRLAAVQLFMAAWSGLFVRHGADGDGNRHLCRGTGSHAPLLPVQCARGPDSGLRRLRDSLEARPQKVTGNAIAGLFLVLAIAAAIFLTQCSPVQRPPRVQSEASRQRQKLTADIKDYARAEDSTYLGFPEWFIVWSDTEKADYQQQHQVHSTILVRLLQRLWHKGEHQMLVLIGGSFTVEYLIRAWYEKTPGHLTKWIASYEPVKGGRLLKSCRP